MHRHLHPQCIASWLSWCHLGRHLLSLTRWPVRSRWDGTLTVGKGLAASLGPRQAAAADRDRAAPWPGEFEHNIAAITRNAGNVICIDDVVAVDAHEMLLVKLPLAKALIYEHFSSGATD
jgi:hypothetical protein